MNNENISFDVDTSIKSEKLLKSPLEELIENFKKARMNGKKNIISNKSKRKKK